MQETMLTAPNRPTSVNRSERHEESIANVTWTATDKIIKARWEQAQAEAADGAEPRDIMLEARKAQLEFLDAADTDDWGVSELTAQRLALVLLEMPEAARAQRQLDVADAYSAGRSKMHRTTLSDFNNDLAATLTHMPPSMMESLPDELLKRNRGRIQGEWHVPSMGPEDLYRSLRGVKREVAFWRALHNRLPDGWTLRQSTAEEDLHGTDFIIGDNNGREMRLDVKARARFNETLVRLARQGWITTDEARIGVREGYVYKPNTDDEGNRDGTYTCIFDADALGVINRYQYDNPARVRQFIETRFQDRQATAARKVGHSAAHLVYRSHNGGRRTHDGS